MAANCNTSLIVDFPSTRRTVSSYTAAKSVRFSSQCEGWYIAYPSKEDNEKKSYNSEDYVYFKRVMERDVLKCSARLAVVDTTAPLDRSSYEKHIIRCVGLDHLVARDIGKRARAVRDARAAHARVVLDEQEWQRSNGADSPGDLAQVSMMNSQGAKMRSRKIAVLSASVH